MAVNQGVAIKEILEEKSVTQTDLAKHLKKKQGWVSTVLKREKIDEDFLKSTAQFLKMPYKDFLSIVNTERKVVNADYVEILENSLKDKDKIIQVQDEQITYLKSQLDAQNGDKLLN